MSEIKRKAGHGGKRTGAGRPPGKVSAAKRAIADKAKEYGDKALATLAAMLDDPEAPHAVKVSAANALLDRGYGRPPQSLALTDDEGGPLKIQIVRYGDDPSSE